MIADLASKLDESNGHPLGLGFTFFGICIFMILIFLLMVWVGKLREKHRGPSESPELPLLVKRDEERERRRNAGH